jgi:hypothetical protein
MRFETVWMVFNKRATIPVDSCSTISKKSRLSGEDFVVDAADSHDLII